MTVKNLHRATTVDTWSGGLLTIDTLHYRTHYGDTYEASNIFNGVADDGTAEMLLQVGSAFPPHIIFNVAVSGNAEVHLFEGTTFSGAGTSLAALNKNRFSSKTPDTTFTHTPTTTGDGTQLTSHFVPGGTLLGSGAHNGIEFEWVLNTDTDYLFRVTNVSGLPSSISITAIFYEDLDGQNPAISQ